MRLLLLPHLKKQLSIIFLSLFLISGLSAQQDTIRVKKGEILILKDSILIPESDTIYLCEPHTRYRVRKNPYSSSELFYKGLKEKSSTNKVTDKLSDLFLVSPTKQTLDNAKAGKSSDKVFEEYEGKIIREIKFKHVDMLEGSVQDTSRFSSSALSIFANKYHYNTREWVLKSNMNIKAGQEVDPFVLADNERLLRRLLYIEDAKIYVKEEGEYVDLIVVVKDRIAWGFQASLESSKQVNLEVFNRSIAGIGRFGSVGYYYNGNSSPIHGYSAKIGGQNTLKAITSWELSHSNYWDVKDYGLNVQREFVTPQVKYGGGLEIRTVTDSTIILDGDTENDRFYKLSYRDIWLGRSFLINSNNDRKNIVLSARVLDHHFDNQPPIASDSNEIYFNRQFFLGQVSYAKQKFIKSNYVVSFGISEDIPVGYRLSFLYGRDFNQFFTQNYYGVQYFWSRYFKKAGYFLINSQFGGFERSVLKTSVFGASVAYYTPLYNLGALERYKSRTFLSAGYINGIRQPESRSLTLENKIRDINGSGIEGDRTKYVRVESILFTPWYFYGFRFTPFVYGSISDIADNRIFAQKNEFKTIGLGIRIRNESLVFNTLEVRATRFVTAPEDTDDFLISFSVSAPITFGNIFRYKPLLIPFQ